jgi:hypothetical protein
LSTTPLGTIRLDRDTVAGQAPPEDSGSLIKFSGAQCHLDTSDAEGYAFVLRVASSHDHQPPHYIR